MAGPGTQSHRWSEGANRTSKPIRCPVYRLFFAKVDCKVSRWHQPRVTMITPATMTKTPAQRNALTCSPRKKALTSVINT